MTFKQHGDLLSCLAGIKGKFLLSGYHSPLYDSWARAEKWRMHEIPIDNKASAKKTKDTKIEVIWMNY